MIQYVHMPLKIMEVTTHQLPEIGRLIYLETSNVSVTLVLLFYFLAIYKHIHQISKLCITQEVQGKAYVQEHLPTAIQFGIFIVGHLILKS